MIKRSFYSRKTVTCLLCFEKSSLWGKSCMEDDVINFLTWPTICHCDMHESTTFITTKLGYRRSLPLLAIYVWNTLRFRYLKVNCRMATNMLEHQIMVSLVHCDYFEGQWDIWIWFDGLSIQLSQNFRQLGSSGHWLQFHQDIFITIFPKISTNEWYERVSITQIVVGEEGEIPAPCAPLLRRSWWLYLFGWLHPSLTTPGNAAISVILVDLLPTNFCVCVIFGKLRQMFWKWPTCVSLLLGKALPRIVWMRKYI